MISQYATSLATIEIIQVVLMIAATAVLIFAITKRREFYILFCSYIFLTIGLIFSILKLVSKAFTLLSLLFYLFATIFLFATVFSNYYILFLGQASRRYQIYLLIIMLGISLLILFGIEYVILGLLFLGIELSLYIYYKKETVVYGLFALAMLVGFISIVTIILEDFGYPWAYELRQGTGLILTSVFLTISIVAILEYRMERTNIQYRQVYNRAELYKDLFLHDVNNILQSILNASEFCSLKFSEADLEKDKEEFLQLFNVIKNQVNRGSNLISNIRILSELDLIKITVEDINLDHQIQQAIQKVEKIFGDRPSELNYNNPFESASVRANKYLSELFYNLLMNSFKYNESKIVKVDINVHELQKNDQKFMQVDIIDNGTGIGEELKQRLNKKELDIINSKKRLGLGLIFVYKLSSYYGGYLQIEDREKEDKKGTKITITLRKS